MSNISHNTLTGSDLHEPKGVATASVGESYVADGSGSGEWKTTGGVVYGEMTVSSNASPQTITVASDTTLNTLSDYVKVDTGIWAAGPICDCGSLSFDSSGYLTTSLGGLYELSFWTSMEASVINSLVAFRFSIDDAVTGISFRKFMRLSGSAGDIGSIAGSGFAQLSAGAKVSLWAATDKTVDITLVEAGVTMKLMSEG